MELITQNGEYKVYVEKTVVDYPTGQIALQFFTEWSSATNAEPQKKFIMFLNDDERQRLKDFL
jgi:hypothetical protein